MVCPSLLRGDLESCLAGFHTHKINGEMRSIRGKMVELKVILIFSFSEESLRVYALSSESYTFRKSSYTDRNK